MKNYTSYSNVKAKMKTISPSTKDFDFVNIERKLEKIKVLGQNLLEDLNMLKNFYD